MKLKKPTLVDNARQCWKWLSVQAMGLGAAVQGAWLTMPEDLKAGIDPKIVTTAAFGLFILGIVGRIIKQEDQ